MSTNNPAEPSSTTIASQSSLTPPPSTSFFVNHQEQKAVNVNGGFSADPNHESPHPHQSTRLENTHHHISNHKLTDLVKEEEDLRHVDTINESVTKRTNGHSSNSPMKIEQKETAENDTIPGEKADPGKVIMLTSNNLTSNHQLGSNNKIDSMLPKVDIPSVPISHIIDRLVHRSYSNLIELSEEMVHSTSLEKKRKLLNYCFTTRRQFYKVLAMVKWSKRCQDTVNCQRVGALIHEKEMGFNVTSDLLFKLHEDLRTAKEPLFDIPNAIDILSTGKYQQLPKVIMNLGKPQSVKLSGEELSQTYKEIHELIRQRLRQDVIPASFRNSIRLERGCLVFKDFAYLYLTLDGTEDSLPWKIVNLSFASQKDTIGVPLKLSEFQLSQIRELAQKKLNQVKQSENEFKQLLEEQMGPVEPGQSNESMIGAGASLLELYDFLINIYLKAKLSAFHVQAKYLSLSYFQHLNVIYDENSQTLLISYWDDQLVDPASIMKEKEGMTSIAISMHSVPNSSFIEEMGKLPRKEMIAWSHANSSKCEIYQRSLTVTYFDFELNESVSSALETNQNIETILRKRMEKNSLYVLGVLKNFLLELSRPLDDPEMDFAEQLGSIRLPIQPDEDMALVCPNDKNSITSSSLLLKYHPEKILRIALDIHTGRLVLFVIQCSKSIIIPQFFTLHAQSEQSENKDENMEIIKEVEISLNQDYRNLPKAIVKLRYDTYVTKLESMASLISMKPFRKLPLSPVFNLSAAVGFAADSLDHVIFYQFPDTPSYYLLIAVCPQNLLTDRFSQNCDVLFMSWIVALWQPSDSIYSELVKCLPIIPQQITSTNDRQNEDSSLFSNFWKEITLDDLSDIKIYASNIIKYVRFLTQIRAHFGSVYRYYFQDSKHYVLPEYLDEDEISICMKSPLLSIPTQSLIKFMHNKNMSVVSSKNLSSFFELETQVLRGTHRSEFLMKKKTAKLVPFSDLFMYTSFNESGDSFVYAFVRVHVKSLDPSAFKFLDKVNEEKDIEYDSQTQILRLRQRFSMDCVESIFVRLKPVLLTTMMVYQDEVLSLKYIIREETSPTKCILNLPDLDSVKMIIQTSKTFSKNLSFSVDFDTANLKIPNEDSSLESIKKSLILKAEVDLVHDGYKRAVKFASVGWQLYCWVLKLKSDLPDTQFEFSVQSMKHFRLVISSIYAFEFFCSSSCDWMSVMDASSINGDKETTPWSRIPGFIESVADPNQPEKPLYYSFVSRFNEDISQATQVQFDIQGSLLRVPHGIFVVSDLFSLTLDLIAQHIRAMCIIMNLPILAKKISGIDKMMAEPVTLRVAYMGPIMISTIGLSPMGCLYLKIKLRSESQDQNELPLNVSDLEIFQNSLNEKMKNISIGQIKEEWLLFLLNLSLLPRPALRDMVQLASFEKSNSLDNKLLKLQWLIQLPSKEQTFTHLPSQELPCSLIDLDKSRMSLVFLFSDSKTSQILPIRYNFSSGVLNLWKKDHDESDLTLVPGDSPFLQQKLATISTKEALNKVQFLERVLVVASTNAIDVRKGGPGKLFPTLQHLTSRKIEELHIK